MPPPPRPRGILRAATAALAVADLLAGVAAVVVGVGGDAAPRAVTPRPVEATAAPRAVLVASVHPLLATTSTSAPAPRATRRVVSTGYCLEGTTSSGVDVGPGMVAMNGVAMGSRWRVHDGPHRGRTLEVTDRIGHGTEFDIWFDDCTEAVAYGRRTITVERIG